MQEFQFSLQVAMRNAGICLAALVTLVSSALSGFAYDRKDAAYITASKNKAVLDYIICLEGVVANTPKKMTIQASLDQAEAACKAAAAKILKSGGEPNADEIRLMIMECGFRPGDASADMGCGGTVPSSDMREDEVAKTEDAEEDRNAQAGLLQKLTTETRPAVLAEIYQELAGLDRGRKEEYRALAQKNRRMADEQKAASDERLRRLSLGTAWRYAMSPDDMGAGEIKTASLKSENEFQFAFPYQGSQRATLTIRQHPRWGLDIFVQVERGQFLSCVSDCYASIRFDAGETYQVELAGPADMSSTIRFFRNSPEILAALRTSNTVMMEVDFYNEGRRVLEFGTSGLEWR
jgi:hypothetical protein